MDAPDLVWLDATELAGLIARGEVTAVEVVQAHLDRIEAVGASVNAFVTVLAEQALQAAGRSRTGVLAGVPFTVKDSFDTAGVRTTRGSLLFADHVPDTDATAVARLRSAGGIVLAKTNLPEMSYWTETDNRVAGRSLNPYDAGRTPGGSSGGESAAIAAGLSRWEATSRSRSAGPRTTPASSQSSPRTAGCRIQVTSRTPCAAGGTSAPWRAACATCGSRCGY